MKKKIKFIMFSALLIAGVLIGSNQLAQSFEFEEETIYINKKIDGLVAVNLKLISFVT